MLILHETEATWAGMLQERKDTCSLVALSISAQRKRQPILWSSRKLPSDAFAVAAVPHGGVLVLTPSLIIYQIKVLYSRPVILFSKPSYTCLGYFDFANVTTVGPVLIEFH